MGRYFFQFSFLEMNLPHFFFFLKDGFLLRDSCGLKCVFLHAERHMPACMWTPAPDLHCAYGFVISPDTWWCRPDHLEGEVTHMNADFVLGN